MKRIVYFFLLFLLIHSDSFAEQINLSTYYPAPFGAYDQLRLVPRSTINGNCKIGTLYIDDDDNNKLKMCQDVNGVNKWENATGVWTQKENNVYTTDFSNANLNVGIGTSTPPFKLSIDTNAATPDGGIIAKGTFNSGADLGNLSAGSYMIFYPKKGAFRVGTLTPLVNMLSLNGGPPSVSPATMWNDSNIGNNSFASGNNTWATGTGTTAMGIGSYALGDYSVALGRAPHSNGHHSVAIGDGPYASGESSIALGYGASADGYRSVALGEASTSGSNSTAVGSGSAIGEASIALGGVVSGDYAMALQGQSHGFGSISLGQAYSMNEYTVAIGFNSRADAPYAMTMGTNTTANKDYALALGFGTTASGEYSTAMGSETLASGDYSTATGLQTSASGTSSTAMGSQTKATNINDFASGHATEATGSTSTAMGGYTKATASAATAMGQSSVASGQVSTAMGFETRARSYASVTIGQYNIEGSGDRNNWVPTDPVFIIGNGSNNVARSNAVTILKNGNVGIGTSTPTQALHVVGIIKVEPSSEPPCNLNAEGGIYFNSSDKSFYGCDGSSWRLLQYGS